MGNNGSRCVMVGEGAGSKGMAINGLKGENGGREAGLVYTMNVGIWMGSKVSGIHRYIIVQK